MNYYRCKNCSAVLNNNNCATTFRICTNCGTDNMIFRKESGWVSITPVLDTEANRNKKILKNRKNQKWVKPI